jgi:hypothetical protein
MASDDRKKDDEALLWAERRIVGTICVVCFLEALKAADCSFHQVPYGVTIVKHEPNHRLRWSIIGACTS